MHWSVGAGATEQGPRLDNQDSWLSAGPVHVVADGMGGHAGGGAASKAVVGAFQQLVTSDPVRPDDVTAAVYAAQLAVAAVSARVGGDAGSTLTGAVAVEHNGQPWWMVINVGDSRVYVLEHGQISQVTVDHSYVQELVDRGQITPSEAHHHPERNIITRAIGDGRRDFDAWLVPVVPGRRLVVASDGLTNALDHARLATIASLSGDVGVAAARLAEAALDAGATDNVTVIVVESEGQETSANSHAAPWPQWGVDDLDDDDTTVTGRR